MKLFYGEVLPEVEIHPEEQTHILKVLRLREGDQITVTDGRGKAVTGKIVIVGKKITLDNPVYHPASPASDNALHIAIAPTKNIDRIEFFLEKSIEMRVAEVTFLLCDHSERKILNMEKIQKQVITASKQCLRFRFPEVHPLVKLDDFIKRCDPAATYVAHCDQTLERVELDTVPPRGKTTILIGPEGDFSARELTMLQQRKIRAITLGESRLRTETAGILVSAWHYLKNS